MKIEQKPVEVLQAQAGLYAKNQNNHEYPGRSQVLLSRLGEFAVYTSDEPELVTYPRQRDKKEFVDGNAVVVEPSGTPLPLYSKSEYADFLKDPRNREQARHLAEMHANYSQFANLIDSMGIHDISYREAGERLNLIGRGSNKAAFGFRAEVDGAEKDLAVIVDHAPDKSHAQKKIIERAANLALVRGKAGFEQGVAWSNDPPVIISERAQGLTLDKLNPEQRAAIPNEHWDKLVANVTDVADQGVRLDDMAGNFFYDPEVGFTVIDFRRSSPGKENDAHINNLRDIQSLREKAVLGTAKVDVQK